MDVKIEFPDPYEKLSLSVSGMQSTLSITWHRDGFSLCVDSDVEDSSGEEEEVEVAEDESCEDKSAESFPTRSGSTTVHHVFPTRDSRSGLRVSEVVIRRYKANLLNKPNKESRN